jgi:class 3 adenylate cyclase/TolB-like protein
VERRLAAILAADVVGCSRLMGSDEAGTLARLKSHRRELIDPSIAEYKGRIVKTTGDGILIELPSVVEAVACAVTVQSGMAERNAVTPEEQRIVFRVGINLGDIIIDGDDIHGNGVNIAARLEAISEPGGICISGIVHDQVRDKLDLAFQDMGKQALKNIARPLRVYRVRLANIETTPEIAPDETAPPLALPDKPSIAVLPFANMSDDPEQEYFADGMVEEIITALSRIRWLFVIARNSSFTYKGKAVDVKQVARELGVRYVLEGSVRKAGGRVRITAQLIEAETGAHLWADRFDGSLEDVFDLQDQVAISAAGVIEPALEADEIRRSGRRPTNDLTAYDLYLRALPVLYAFPSKERVLAALAPLEEAISRDPYYGPALALAAVGYARLFDWREAPEINRRKGIERAQQALQAVGDNPDVLANAAFALSFLGEDIGTQIELVERALALNPSFARGWFLSAPLRVWAGEPALAIEHIEKMLRLNPRASGSGNYFWVLGIANFFLRRFETAAALMLKAVQQTPAWPCPIAPRRVLCPDGKARRGARGDREAARVDFGDRAAAAAVPQSRTSGALPVGPALGGWRGEMSQTRRLAAILAADVAGYSRLMGADEKGTLERLKALRRELLDPKIAEHHGRIVKTTGDGLLVEFASVVDAVRCAVEVQQAMAERDIGVAADNRIELRIGINLGDVIVEGDDLYGDGVNIAARVEALADAGGVLVSNTV